MTPSKDTLETANPAAGSALPESSTPTKQDASRTRSDAVSLELQVKVHGSRVKDVVLGTTPHTEPFEEKTSTMIVFPQGGVLKMSTPVTAGQMMVVTNLKSGHDAICRVIQVRAFGHGQSYVEIEFTHRQPGYWGVQFQSDGGARNPIAPAAPVAPPVSVEVKVEKPLEKPSPEISRLPASSLKAPIGKSAPKPESVFAPIGSQEEVQPAASATSRVRSNPGRDTDRKGVVVEAARKSLLADLPPVVPPSPAASVSMADLQGDARASSGISFAGAGVPGESAEVPSIEVARVAEQDAAPFGRFAASASLGGSHAAREPFGSGIGGAAFGTSAVTPDSRQTKGLNWQTIAAAIAVLLVVAVGAAYYLHLPPFGIKSARPSASVPPSTEPVPAPSVASQPVSSAPTAPPAAIASVPVAASTPAAATPVNEPAAPAVRPRKPEAPAPVATTAPVEQKTRVKAPDISSALNVHPKSRAHSADSEDADNAPSIDGGASAANGALPAIASSAAIAPPAPAQPQGPVRIRVGGALKPPQLVSSVLPVYPMMARDSGVEGDVVIDTTIDAKGKVAAMKVVSGPAMLRQAALDALRQWKYAPSMLNGEAIPIQMMVTIKFHR